MQKKLLIGNFGAGNLGDELILSLALEKNKKSLVMTNDAGFSQKFCENKFETIPPFPAGIKSFLKLIFEVKYREKIREIKKNRAHFTEVIFCGGGLFAIKNKAFFIWYMTFLWVNFLFKKEGGGSGKTKISFEYQGIDKPKNKLQKYILKKVFSQVETISVRDSFSGRVLGDLGIKNYEIKEDLVFEKRENLKKISAQKKAAKGGQKNLVLINGVLKISNNLIQKIIKKYPHNEIIFVAFSAKDKGLYHKNKNFKKNGINFLYPQTKTELLDLFAQAQVVLGQRFHSLVLGKILAKEVFVLGEPYSQKVQNFCEAKKVKVFEE